MPVATFDQLLTAWDSIGETERLAVLLDHIDLVRECDFQLADELTEAARLCREQQRAKKALLKHRNQAFRLLQIAENKAKREALRRLKKQMADERIRSRRIYETMPRNLNAVRIKQSALSKRLHKLRERLDRLIAKHTTPSPIPFGLLPTTKFQQ